MGTSSSPPASIRRTLTSGFSASRRATTDPDEPDPQIMKSYCDFISDDSLDRFSRTRSTKSPEQRPFIKASIISIEVGFTDHFLTTRCRMPLLRLRMQYCRRPASAVGSASSSRGAASAVIEKCGHVPAFAFGERGERGFPGHGKVRLEAVAHPLELHVVPG